MECKCFLHSLLLFRHLRINRNIVECKFACTNHIEIRFIELIETLWNVNILLGYLHRLQLRELIETLWNVNCNKSIYHNYHHTELIETLWNVNINGSNLTHDERVGINRNIVECKCGCIHRYTFLDI